MRNLTIILNRQEAQSLLNCLMQPDPKGKDLDLQLEIEDILANYLKITADDDKLAEYHKELEEQKKSECKHCGRRNSSTMCKLFPAPCKNK